jgi:hypothetical protein
MAEVNQKARAVPVHTVKSNTRRNGTAPVILNLGTGLEVSGQLHALATLSPKERTPGTQ